MKSVIFKMGVLLVACLCALASSGQKRSVERYNAIHSGVPLFDDQRNIVSAHGACIVKDKDRYYLFGEKHYDNNNSFAGFNCYSSADLYNWKFEKIALPVQPSGKLGPNRVGERPKVMKCPKTGEYVMFMHVDTLGYVDQFVGYATSSSITGPYTFKGPLLFEGKPIKKWDMGTFQDQDGSGYVLIHGGEIYKLNDDYKSIAELTNKNMAHGFESPTLFRKDDLYYFLGSNLTSWERNDNYYYTATSLKGPWTKQGMFCPEGSLTWNSQCTFVLPITGTKNTAFMYMGDRWAFPKQASAATYVWQPLTVSGTSISIPQYRDAWQINTLTGEISIASERGHTVENTDNKSIRFSGDWKDTAEAQTLTSSDKKDATASFTFRGGQLKLYSLSRPDGGYANVVVKDAKGLSILSGILDMYSKIPVAELKFVTPVLSKDTYTLQVRVAGEHGNWSDKRKNLFGSTGNTVSIDKLVVIP